MILCVGVALCGVLRRFAERILRSFQFLNQTRIVNPIKFDPAMEKGQDSVDGEKIPAENFLSFLR